MRRKLVFVAIFVLAVAAGFVGRSWAFTSHATGTPSDFAVESLPPAQLSPSDQASVASIVGPRGAIMSGASSSAGWLNNVRLLAQTVVGPMYLLSDVGGLCVVLLPTVQDSASAISCGDWSGARQMAVSLFVHDPVTGFVVGAGLTSIGVQRVSVASSDGSTTPVKVSNGAFAISPGDQISDVKGLGNG